MKYGAIIVEYRCKNCGETVTTQYCLGVLCDYAVPPDKTNGVALIELGAILKSDKFGKILPRVFHDCVERRELSFLNVLEGASAGVAVLVKIKCTPAENEAF